LEETFYLFGEKGTVKAGGQSVNGIDTGGVSDVLDEPEAVIMEFTENPPNIYGFEHIPLYADVIDAIENNRKAYVDVATGKWELVGAGNI